MILRFFMQIMAHCPRLLPRKIANGEVNNRPEYLIPKEASL